MRGLDDRFLTNLALMSSRDDETVLKDVVGVVVAVVVSVKL